MDASWVSPDGKIRKEVVVAGRFGVKPYEASECSVKVENCSEPLSVYFKDKTVTIGDNDGDLGRAVDVCLTTMHVGERAKFDIKVDDNEHSIDVELVELNFKGFIYEWDAKRIFALAQHHKDRGVAFYKENDTYEAGFRFTKALKLISLIPIDVQQPPESVDDISLSDIKKLKANLYSNLSSCYFKKERYEMVVGLCNKVFTYDKNHVKALYKIGIAYEHGKDYENADKALSRVMEMEPNNKACAEHLALVKSQLKQADIRVKNIMKKMFEAI